MTKQEFVNITGIITSVWDVNFDKVSMQVWYAALQDLDYKKTEMAVEKLVATSKYKPTPAHLREAYNEIEEPKINTVDMLIIIDNAITKYGRYRAEEAMNYIKQQDEATYIIVKALGFLNICDNKPVFLKPELEKLHKEVSENFSSQKNLPDKLKIKLKNLNNKLYENALALKSGDEFV